MTAQNSCEVITPSHQKVEHVLVLRGGILECVSPNVITRGVLRVIEYKLTFERRFLIRAIGAEIEPKRPAPGASQDAQYEIVYLVVYCRIFGVLTTGILKRASI